MMHAEADAAEEEQSMTVDAVERKNSEVPVAPKRHGDMHRKGEIATALLERSSSYTIGAVEEVRRLCMISGWSQDQTKRVIVEMFSPPRVCQKVTEQPRGSLSAGTSFDLQVNRETGERWDFLKAQDRRACWERLRAEDPWVVIGCPPCTDFCALNEQWNFPRMPEEEVARRKFQSMTLLRFALSVYTWQVRRGRYFLHEHPHHGNWKK